MRLAVEVGGGAHGGDDLQQHLFPFADDEDVDEGGHRLRVVAGVTAGDDQGVARVAVGRAHRQPGQVEQVQGVGKQLLIGQGHGQHVEVANGVLRLQREEGDAAGAQRRFHVVPGAEDALGQQVAVLVDDVVVDHPAQVRHADVVEVGEGHGHAIADAAPLLDDLVEFAAGVAAGFGDAGEDALQRGFDCGG